MPHVDVTGDLYLPARADGPLPAIILSHGSGGLSGARDRMAMWTKLLNSWGVAALVVDSFGPRGVRETASDQSRVPEAADIADAFSAMKVLAADTRIDRNRIGVMGFSRGGNVATTTALESLRSAALPPNLRFALHIPFYPSCSTLMTDKATDRAPMLFLHGEADDQTSAEQCREVARWFETMGHPTKFFGYAGAYHGFDNPTGHVTLHRKDMIGTKCDAALDVSTGRYTRLNHVPSTTITNEQHQAYIKSCRIRGGSSHQGANPAAREDAIERVHAFLVEYLGAK